MTTTPAPSIAATLLTGTSTGPFPTGFKYNAAEDVRVWLELAGVRQPDLTLTTHYTLTGATPLVDGGTVALDADLVPDGGWAAGDRVVIVRRTVKRQALALPDAEGHKPRSTEAALDKLMRVGEEHADQLALAVSARPGEAGVQLPTVAQRAGRVAVFDDDGQFDADAPTMEGFAAATQALSDQTSLARRLFAAEDGAEFIEELGPLPATGVEMIQSGQYALAEPIQDTLRRIVVMPEQFSGTDTQRVQAAFDSAGDVLGGQNVARVVRLSRFYITIATINVPSYVAIEGVGAGRSGLASLLTSGPALRASVANNTSSYLTEWRDFGINGANAGGSAYALEMVGQKITTLSRVRFSSFDTSEHAVQFKLGCQSIILDQCQWYNNRMAERIGVPYVGVSFPTTIIHKGCIYEGDVDDGPSAGAETILVQDANGCVWDQKCVFQSCDTPVLIRVTASAGQQTAANHTWDNVYLEGNGASHATTYTWKFEGVSGQPILGCKIVNSDVHGPSPTAHVHATYTDLLTAPVDQNPASHTWFADGGNNTRRDYVFIGSVRFGSAPVIDFDSGNVRVWNLGGNISGYLTATQNLWTHTTHAFGSIGAGTMFATITTTGLNLTAGRAVFVDSAQVLGARVGGDPGAATDPATTQTLANWLRTVLTTHGIGGA